MAEQITLVTPAVPQVLTDYQVVYLEFDWDEPRIAIRLRGPSGERIGHHYVGGTATTLMRMRNQVDLSTTSLQRRVLQRLVADGVISGAISGVPD